VSGIIQPLIEAAIGYVKGETDFNAVRDLIFSTAREIASGDAHVRMPGWHGPHGLGRALVRFMGVRPEEMFADDLGYVLSEALMALFLTLRDMLRGFTEDPDARWDPHALEQLKQLHDWSVQVFLGTNERQHPGVTLSDFRWRPVASERH
jgi:hypothetical protein